MLPQEIIRKIRDRKKLSFEEISFLVGGIAKGDVADVQAASFTMAVFLNGLDKEETLALTLAMRDSGERLSWGELGDNAPIVDKHSTGGVGDKVSLMLAPMLAACGAYVPMIAGRGLGHTGGTLDKLDSLAGYNTSSDTTTFKRTVKNVGCAIIGQTADLAPADKKLYAIRDVSATVESIPLITASILSKKLAAGLKYLVMDIKCGNGAFMENRQRAEELAQSIVSVANGAGTKTTALLTDMNSILGTTVGNALEVGEALSYLKGEKPDSRLDEVTKALCGELLIMCGLAENKDKAYQKLNRVIANGDAYEHFVKMAVSLGVNASTVEKYDILQPKASYVVPVYAKEEGYVSSIDTRQIGLGVIMLGGGRVRPEQKINYTTGFTSFCQIGDKIDVKTPLCYIHSEDESVLMEVSTLVQQAIHINEEKPRLLPTILEKIN
jgi:thymidine phosphorylase